MLGRRGVTFALLAVLAAMMVSVTASKASALALGVDWSGEYGWAEQESEMATIAKSGATLFRMPIVPVNTAGGTSWTYYDKVVGGAARQGMAVLPWFEGRMNGGAGLPTAAEKTEYIAWLKKAVRRYGYKGVYWTENPTVPYHPVYAWELWNEPNNPSHNSFSAAEYGAFLAWAGPAIQTASESWGEAKTGVLFGGLLAWSGGTGYQSFLGTAYKVSGAAAAITGVGFHPYELDPNGFKGETRVQAFATAVTGVRNYLSGTLGGTGKTLWITEVGWPAEAEYAVGDAEQSNLLKGSVNWAKGAAASLNLQALLWYNARDLGSPAIWQNRSGLRRSNNTFRAAWDAFQFETGAAPWPGGTYSFQGNTGQLFTMNLAGGVNTEQGMASGTSPGIASLATGGYESAIQTNAGTLLTFGDGGNTNWGQGMYPGSSPAISLLTGGGYQVAFKANTGSLITIGTAGGTNWGLYMAPESNPSITGLSTGGWEAAAQESNSQLWVVGTAGVSNTGLGMAAGTSPSIAGFEAGGYEIAFQANSGHLWTIGSAGNKDWELPVKAGTSPSIASLVGGGYEVAYQAPNGELRTVGTAGNVNWGQGMAPGTSPSVAALINGGYEVAFQSNTNKLVTISPFGSVSANTGQGMAPGTSPSLAMG